MSDAWRQYKSAPPAGTVLLECSRLPPGDSQCLSLESDNGRFPLIIARDAGGEVRAYVNACPHQYLPLNGRSDTIMSRDGELLICTHHQACFRLDSGEGISGPAQGEALDPVPVVEKDGWWVIGE
ncbi:Rieske 2Fe-2S domain-containing protein [Halomonas denitrificans]|uniref:Rieske (2Fe-2S) protein n=1 Tax=Halomonas TaxID=2745 RepID=UPI001C93923F|nr:MULTISPECIES: Rieske 2Fe-2S domain-containing protein [Halomonas]MBY5925175.1 Rieske 2Fe-2S domain-containing protein [Halomonas sp. DP4Y7-2]MBY5983587.1 Rieske 2Fe-2S domain-containing protein [Halomonas sp. DP5Y7-2]MBY6031284.1 Rieske 2Fe-2S domain-containing protein [Halomonas sp. DP8Y7-1]MBY6232216.1 Rieske 2Fe-2S domain-containing protein [Halomonas sp. DP4Y7-1]MCA0974084.1 Rieske 2Fe-2S domain-containing protein [Halomonas denitrificans]